MGDGRNESLTEREPGFEEFWILLLERRQEVSVGIRLAPSPIPSGTSTVHVATLHLLMLRFLLADTARRPAARSPIHLPNRRTSRTSGFTLRLPSGRLTPAS